MADEFEIITEIRPTDKDGNNGFNHDQVKLTARNERLELRYCEAEEKKGDDGNWRTVRKEFRFELSYAEFDAMAEAVERARKVAEVTA